MKTKFKGSEGKWGCVFTSDKKRAVRNKGGLICTLYHPSKYSGQDERYDLELEQMRADQRLIANAPELLFALQEMIAFAEFHGYTSSTEINNARKVLEETLT